MTHSADAAGDAADLPAGASGGAGRIRGEAIGAGCGRHHAHQNAADLFLCQHRTRERRLHDPEPDGKHPLHRREDGAGLAEQVSIGRSGAREVRSKAFDDIYGNRMGNRPGSHDGSTYIGRGEARRWSHGCEEEKPSMNDTATTEQPTAPAADVDWEWTIVEIFGHRRHVGKAREEEKFGTKLLRIGVPKLGPGPGEIMWSGHFYGGPVRTVVWEGRSCETPSYPDSRFRGVRFPEFTS
jgi:hypothetical protein